MKQKTKSRLLWTAGTLAVAGAVILLQSCKATIPAGVKAVSTFDTDRYLGKWYEIARFDFRFERGLDHTTAEYSKNEDGTIRVVNRGRRQKDGTWKDAVGKARFVGEPDVAMLKVSFFGPFYAGYNVIALDPDYKHALVAGQSRKYLWILSREKTIPEEVRQRYLAQARALGFNTEKLLWPEQE